LLVQYTAEAAFALSIPIYLLKLACFLVIPKGIIHLEKGYYFLSGKKKKKTTDVWFQIPRLLFL